MVSALTIREPGDSDILKLTEADESSKESEIIETEETDA
jgi:hypothetical protein